LITIAASHLRHMIRYSLLLSSFGAGIMVSGYAVLDSYGARLSGDWLSFTAWLVILDSTIYLLVVRTAVGSGTWTALSRMRWRILISGLLGLASFSVFLWALSRNAVGLVSALRETSILFAILFGFFHHREKLTVSRLVGGTLILIGVIVIAM
jgi:uncharacterized membrane protein